jgi:uncharacterized LabA/DUF88 family protein
MTGRLAVFIDGPALYYSSRALGFQVDFKRLLSYLERQGALMRAYYYSPLSEDGDFQTTRPLLDWLDYNGFTVKTKLVKEYDDGEGRRKLKRNISIEIAVDALEIASRVDEIMLFSGDGDYRKVIEARQRQGPRALVVSPLRSRPPMLADELRRQADEFREMDDLRDQIGRATAGSMQEPPALTTQPDDGFQN